MVAGSGSLANPSNDLCDARSCDAGDMADVDVVSRLLEWNTKASSDHREEGIHESIRRVHDEPLGRQEAERNELSPSSGEPK